MVIVCEGDYVIMHLCMSEKIVIMYINIFVFMTFELTDLECWKAFQFLFKY